MDATGREVLVRGLNTQRMTLDLRGVARGSYQLMLELPDGRITARVMVE